MKTVACDDILLPCLLLLQIGHSVKSCKVAQSDNLVVLQFLPCTARCGVLECIKTAKAESSQQTRLSSMRMYISYVIKPVGNATDKETVRTWPQKAVLEHQNASVHHSIQAFSADSGPAHCQAYNCGLLDLNQRQIDSCFEQLWLYSGQIKTGSHCFFCSLCHVRLSDS